jgi:hypothetical protein
MKIQLPAPVQGAFDRFRQTGSLGEGAEKGGPEMEMLRFSAMVDSVEQAAELEKYDDMPGMDNAPGKGHLNLTPAALQGKPYTNLEASTDETNTVIIHKSAGDKHSYEMRTSYNGGPAQVVANQQEDGSWQIGSNLMVMKDGMVEVTDSGIPRCDGEFLVAR